MHSVYIFFNAPFFTIYGGISVLFTIGCFFYAIYLVIRGVIPVWYKIGTGISKAKIAIFSSADEYSSLKSMLADSIFREKNIIQVSGDDLDKASGLEIFLVCFKTFESKLNRILEIKKDNTILIVYAPQNDGQILDSEILKEINSRRNAIIVNFRGRLLNDIFVSLITASCRRKSKSAS